jgi:hypothetical protein
MKGRKEARKEARGKGSPANYRPKSPNAYNLYSKKELNKM